MHNAPAAQPPHPAHTPRWAAAPPRQGQAVLAALARTVQRVLPLRRAADSAGAAASDDSEETAMHSPCL